MKPIYAHLGGALALSFTLAACVPAPDSTPAPTPTPTPVQTTPAPPPPAPPAANWIDEPRTPGDWSYSSQGGGSTAQYLDARGAPVFSIVCLRADRRVTLIRNDAGSATPAMTIRTETTDRTLATSTLAPDGAGRSRIGVYLGSSDPLLDAMAITRGRFAVETPGLSTLYLPPWAEVTRVIEQCR